MNAIIVPRELTRAVVEARRLLQEQNPDAKRYAIVTPELMEYAKIAESIDYILENVNNLEDFEGHVGRNMEVLVKQVGRKVGDFFVRTTKFANNSEHGLPGYYYPFAEVLEDSFGLLEQRLAEKIGGNRAA